MKARMLQVIELSELALVNMNWIVECIRHNPVHQRLLLATTKSLSGTSATISLHTTLLRTQGFSSGAGLKHFMAVASPLPWGSHASYGQLPHKGNTCPRNHPPLPQHQVPLEHTHYSSHGNYALVANVMVSKAQALMIATTNQKTKSCYQSFLIMGREP